MTLARTLLLCASLTLASGAARADEDAGPVEGAGSDTAGEAEADEGEDGADDEEAPTGIQPTTTPDNLGCAASSARSGASESAFVGALALAVVAVARGRGSRRSP